MCIRDSSKRTGTLLELNNSSLGSHTVRQDGRKNMLTMLDLCRQYDVPVTTGSDAHVDADAGNLEQEMCIRDRPFPRQFELCQGDWRQKP